VKEAERSVLATIVQAGRELQSVKDALGHGTFGKWLADEFGATARTAQKYMRLAAAVGGEYELISHLPRPLVDDVAAQSCPEECGKASLLIFVPAWFANRRLLLRNSGMRRKSKSEHGLKARSRLNSADRKRNFRRTGSESGTGGEKKPRTRVPGRGRRELV
jgi:hypothetical protein